MIIIIVIIILTSIWCQYFKWIILIGLWGPVLVFHDEAVFAAFVHTCLLRLLQMMGDDYYFCTGVVFKTKNAIVGYNNTRIPDHFQHI